MSTTIQSIVNQIAVDLLEPAPNAFGTGIVTQQQVLDLIGVVVADFLQQTGLIWSVFTQQLDAGISQYFIPDSQIRVFYVLQNAQVLDQIDLSSEYLVDQWERKPGVPLAYHEDGLPSKSLEVVPAPNWNGTSFSPTYSQSHPDLDGTFNDFQPGKRNLTTVASTLPSKESWGIGDMLDGIPDTFVPFVQFGVLAAIFSSDSEAKDLARSQYCKSRFDEGVAIGRSILMELSGMQQP